LLSAGGLTSLINLHLDYESISGTIPSNIGILFENVSSTYIVDATVTITTTIDFCINDVYVSRVYFNDIMILMGEPSKIIKSLFKNIQSG